MNVKMTTTDNGESKQKPSAKEEEVKLSNEQVQRKWTSQMFTFANFPPPHYTHQTLDSKNDFRLYCEWHDSIFYYCIPSPILEDQNLASDHLSSQQIKETKKNLTFKSNKMSEQFKIIPTLKLQYCRKSQCIINLNCLT